MIDELPRIDIMGNLMLLAVDMVGVSVYSRNMDVSDKMFYYGGLVAIVLGSTLIVLGALGLMSSTWVAIVRGSIALVVGLGLFGRGLSAKRRAEQKLLDDAIASLSRAWPDEPHDQN